MPRFSCTPGFLLLMAILYFLDDGSMIWIWSLVWAVIHELGHAAAACLFHGRVEEVNLNSAGMEMKLIYPRVLSYSAENLVLIGGPVCNLLAAVLAMWGGRYLGAAIGIGLGLFNLLPILPLDGGRLWLNLISSHFGPSAGDKTLLITSILITGILFGIGLIALVRFANGIIVFVAGWLLVNALKNTKK